ncbi:hypothetical protein [Streptomyces sp. GSL17-111]|uniref:hypothetical protein n=1 Tax=Streptomyces sp. GSL17-111 TaxID=3121596 RepID=UPI0030F49B2D
MDGHAVGLQQLGGAVRQGRAARHGRLQRAEQPRPGGGLRGDGAGERREGVTRVGQAEPQAVRVPGEAVVDDGDPLVRRDVGQPREDVGGPGGGTYGEPEGAQVRRQR